MLVSSFVGDILKRSKIIAKFNLYQCKRILQRQWISRQNIDSHFTWREPDFMVASKHKLPWGETIMQYRIFHQITNVSVWYSIQTGGRCTKAQKKCGIQRPAFEKDYKLVDKIFWLLSLIINSFLQSPGILGNFQQCQAHSRNLLYSCWLLGFPAEKSPSALTSQVFTALLFLQVWCRRTLLHFK